jgi:hypothetical protein
MLSQRLAALPKLRTLDILGRMLTLETTTPTPFGARTKLPLVFEVSMVLLATAILLPISPVAQTWSKFRLVSLKAVRSGSPCPSFGTAPMLITYCVMSGFSLFYYLWLNAYPKHLDLISKLAYTVKTL